MTWIGDRVDGYLIYCMSSYASSESMLLGSKDSISSRLVITVGKGQPVLKSGVIVYMKRLFTHSPFPCMQANCRVPHRDDAFLLLLLLLVKHSAKITTPLPSPIPVESLSRDDSRSEEVEGRPYRTGRAPKGADDGV